MEQILETKKFLVLKTDPEKGVKSNEKKRGYRFVVSNCLISKAIKRML